MKDLFPVMIGGALGAGARWLVSGAMFAWTGPGFPWGTLLVNIGGGLAMGLVAGGVAHSAGDAPWRLFLAVGVLGGFTTFSAFGLEVWTLLERGEALAAASYMLASVVGAVAATGLGLALVRAA